MTKSTQAIATAGSARSRLTLDVCVAIAACHVDGNTPTDVHEQAVHETKCCLEVLDIVFGNPLIGVAMSDRLIKEWVKQVFDAQEQDPKRVHAAEWFTDMDTSDRINHLGDVCYPFLVQSPSRIRHDRGLIESALQADKMVVSIDEDIREELVAYVSAGHGNGIGDLCWANPDVRTDHTCKWLASGLPVVQSLLLASPPHKRARLKTRARK
jgi:hypothetical protein